MKINDSHCHFFSPSFFEALGRLRPGNQQAVNASEIVAELEWEDPVSPSDLASRWVHEMDRHGVQRAALIASVPGDEDSVKEAVSLYPERFVGFFMLDPVAPDALSRLENALAAGLRCVCLFPAMLHFHLFDPRVRQIFEVVEDHPGTAVFAHCGVLSVGVRKKLGIPSIFDLRYSNPLDLHATALRYPDVPIIIPHFGAGMFREALMLADLCPNVHLDTSSSNSWIRYYTDLSLEKVFRQVLQVAGANRLLFGTDSSYFPRGWNRTVFDDQLKCVETLNVGEDTVAKIFGENFDRIFPL